MGETYITCREENGSINISEDVDEMIRRGFRSAPVLDVDGESMDFSTAVKWVDSKEG